MGDPAKSVRREVKDVRKKALGGVEKRAGMIDPTRSARVEAREAGRRQESLLARQTQQEQLRLAEAESEVGRRRFLRGAGGRRSLIASR